MDNKIWDLVAASKSKSSLADMEMESQRGQADLIIERTGFNPKPAALTESRSDD